MYDLDKNKKTDVANRAHMMFKVKVNEPLKNVIDVLEEISKINNIEMYILSLSKTKKITEKKKALPIISRRKASTRDAEGDGANLKIFPLYSNIPRRGAQIAPRH